MITLNAILKAKLGSEEALYQALVEIGEHVSRSEPGTVGFYVGRDTQDPPPIQHLRTFCRCGSHGIP